MVNTGLADTSVFVDVLRRHLPAVQWLSTQPMLGVSQAVWLEVLNGVQNSAAQIKYIKLLQAYQRVDLLTADIDWAIEKLQAYRLSHGVGILDCLIAAPAERLQVPLYTQNLKHFQPLIGSLAQKPY